jgi:hypothetical protein
VAQLVRRWRSGATADGAGDTGDIAGDKREERREEKRRGEDRRGEERYNQKEER